MTAPSLTTYYQGLGEVNADGLNTFMQDCLTIPQLRAFIGLVGMFVFVGGTTSVGDGGQGIFYWNASAISPVDNNSSIIVPPGAGSGCWQLVPLSAVSGIVAGTGINISGSTISVANTGVNAGSYVNSNLTVNAEGQITSIANGNGAPAGLVNQVQVNNGVGAFAGITVSQDVTIAAAGAATVNSYKGGNAFGTATGKAATSTNASVASVTGSFTTNHVAQFADIYGTIQDGGVLGTMAAQNSNNVTITNGSIDSTSIGLTTVVTGRIRPVTVTFSGTSKNLALTDAETLQNCTNSGANTASLDLNANIAFPVGTVINFQQTGSGASFVAALSTGTSINGSAGGYKQITAQYKGGYLFQSAADVWDFIEG